MDIVRKREKEKVIGNVTKVLFLVGKKNMAICMKKYNHKSKLWYRDLISHISFS
jgi:hypothetical protein